MNTARSRQELEAFWMEQDGVTAIEYALLAALIVIVIAASIGVVGGAVRALFDKVAAIFPLAG